MTDIGQIEDIYALLRLKGSGLPDQARIAKMAKATAKRKGKLAILGEAGINLLISKRKMSLESLSKLPLFVGLMQHKDPVESVRRILTDMKTLYQKTRQSQCVGCSLRAQCDFGKQYGDAFRDVSKVVDANFDKKVHVNCPVLPEIDGFNQMVAATKQFAALMQAQNSPLAQAMNSVGGANNMEEVAEQAEDIEENHDADEDDEQEEVHGLDEEDDEGADYTPPVQQQTPGGSGKFDGKLDGNSLINSSEKLIRDLTQKQLALFQLGQRFSKELTAAKKSKFKPTTDLTPTSKDERIESVSEEKKVLPVQHGLPKEVFEAGIEQKRLLKSKNTKPQEKKKLLYLLIDISASMMGWLGDCHNGLFTRNALSAVFSIAVAQRVRDDGGVLYSRFFTGNVSDLTASYTLQDYVHHLKLLGLPSCRQGSTNITAVVTQAIEDVVSSKESLASAEILLITDCEDSFNEKSLQDLLKANKIELNTLDVAGGTINSGSAQSLRKISSRYFKANENEPDITKIVSLV